MTRYPRLPLRLAAAGLLALAMAACAGGGADSGAAPAEEDTRMVTDAYGREVEVPAEVTSSAIDGGCTRLVIYAGGVDTLVGLSEIDKKPNIGMPYSVVYAEQFADIPATSTAGPQNTPYEEAILESGAQVVFSSKTDVGELDQLQEKLGTPVIGTSQDGVFTDGVQNSILTAGEVLGTQERAREVIDQMDAWEEDLSSRTADVPDDERPTAYPGAVNFRGKHGFDGTNANYVPFEAIGAINVAARPDEQMGYLVDLEQVAEWDPDYIFLNPENMDLVNQGYANNPAFFDSLRAVQEGNVYAHPPYVFSYTNPEVAVANAYYAGVVMFPEEFDDVDPQAKADEIFEFFYDEPLMDTYEEAGMGFGKLTIGEN